MVQTFIGRVGLQQTAVLPDSIFSNVPTGKNDPSSLRKDASQCRLCYFRAIKQLADDTYIARVAASPKAVETGGYTIILTEAQLTQAIPWDARAMARIKRLGWLNQEKPVLELIS
jgi:hypothetical protein